MNHWPKLRKESTYTFTATHDLAGITAHYDAQNPHEHEWSVTCIFYREVNCKQGFGRDEVDIDSAWGARINELNGKNLSEMMRLPATSENLALWLLEFWFVRLSPHKLNYEVDGVRVSKCKTHSCEVMRTQQNHEGWKLSGGEVA